MNKVELIGTYGSDLSHSLSAWTSTSRDLDDAKRARVPALLKRLAEEGHHTPFEKSALQFLIDVDTATHIQQLKHRIGVSINGESARYKKITTIRHHIPPDWPEEWKNKLIGHTLAGQALYEEALVELTPLLGKKRSKESSRYFLGYNNVLTLDVMFNFRSFMHFQGLRGKDDAQDEIHWISDEMLRLVREQGDFKHSLEAFGYK